MGKKDKLAKILYQSGALCIAKLLTHYDLKILAYHRVVNVELSESYPFDLELVSATISDFERQMEYLKKHYKPTTFEQVLRRLSRNEKIDKNSVIVTFDDGFDDNYVHAYPVLKRLNIPATFFISTSYIGTSKVFWFDWIVYLVKKLPVGRLYLNRNAFVFDVNESNRLKVCHEILAYVKNVSDSQRISLIHELECLSDMSQPEEGFLGSHPMSWAQVREMSEAGMEIGSHSCTHPILSKLSVEMLEKELVDSKVEIERELGKECLTISYPVGGRAAFNSKVKMICEANYRVGCSYISGSNNIDSSDLFELKRLHVERYTSIERFASMLAAPTIFG